MRRPRFLMLSSLAVTGCLVAFAFAESACGSRTGLLEPDPVATPIADATVDHRDSSDATADRDADATLPIIDATPAQDVYRADCPDPSATLIYVVTTDGQLLSFYPPTATFRTIGAVACPGGTVNPFSMAVDRRGTAYMLSFEGNLYRVSTRNASCTSTTYVPGQSNFQSFGMGFATKRLGPEESLYIAGSGRGTDAATGLATLDVGNFGVGPIGNFGPVTVSSAELTGTGDGRLFGFYTRAGTTGSFIGEIDKNTAQIIAETPLPMVDQGRAWAFAYWGGDFYLFVAPAASTGALVIRYRPDDSTVAPVSAWSSPIVGAGVSTCAPQ